MDVNQVNICYCYLLIAILLVEGYETQHRRLEQSGS
jgi:hypothetical protein